MQSLFVLNFLASKKRNEFLSTFERGTVKEQALKEAADISCGQGPDFMVLVKPEDKWNKLEKTILDIVEEVFLNLQNSRAVTFPFNRIGCTQSVDSFAEQSRQNSLALIAVEAIHIAILRLPIVKDDYTSLELQSENKGRPTVKAIIAKMNFVIRNELTNHE